MGVSERTIYRDLAELIAQRAPIEGAAGVGYILRPGLFLPPLMLSEDETEAVLLGLRYVDQRGDEVLTNAGVKADHPPIQRWKGQRTIARQPASHFRQPDSRRPAKAESIIPA